MSRSFYIAVHLINATTTTFLGRLLANFISFDEAISVNDVKQNLKIKKAAFIRGLCRVLKRTDSSVLVRYAQLKYIGRSGHVFSGN